MQVPANATTATVRSCASRRRFTDATDEEVSEDAHAHRTSIDMHHIFFGKKFNHTPQDPP